MEKHLHLRIWNVISERSCYGILIKAKMRSLMNLSAVFTERNVIPISVNTWICSVMPFTERNYLCIHSRVSVFIKLQPVMYLHPPCYSLMVSRREIYSVLCRCICNAFPSA